MNIQRIHELLRERTIYPYPYTKRFLSSQPNGVTMIERVRNALAGWPAALPYGSSRCCSARTWVVIWIKSQMYRGTNSSLR